MQRAPWNDLVGPYRPDRAGQHIPLRDQVGPWKVRVAALPFLKVNTLNGMHPQRTHELFCCSGINRVYVLKPSQQ